MAIWQFSFYIIDRKNNYMIINSEEALLWDISDLPKEFFAKLAQILPQKQSWCREIDCYGRGDSTCLELLKVDKNSAEICIRLDLRSLTMEYLTQLIQILQMLNANILYNGEIYETEMQVIISLIKNSRAAKFLKDPLEYFAGL